MKKLFLVFALVVVMFAFPMNVIADIIGNVNLTLSYSSPTGYVTFPSVSGNYYLDYDVSLNNGAPDEAFCVESKNAPTSPSSYTLLTIDSGLSDFGLNASKYLAAAWIAEYYYTTYEGKTSEETMKAAAQIAVWEVIFDNTFDLALGDFKTNAYTDAANTIWTAKPTEFPTSSSTWALAVSPTVTVGGKVSESDFQNYLVHYNVPEPAALLLLGLGLVGIGILRRKQSVL